MRLFTLLLLLSTSLFAQDDNAEFVGYWQVNVVTVGQDTMTPVAKWFHFGPDGSMQGGNGGNINLFGSWQMEFGQYLLFSNQAGEPDPAGSFAADFAEKLLVLTREEEGQPVQVILQRFAPTNWPMAPWDKIAGSWALDIELSGTDGFATDFETAFFRWDNQVRFNTTEGRWTAIWRINAHRPVLELAPQGKEGLSQSWQLRFTDQQMIWSREQDGQTQRLVWVR